MRVLDKGRGQRWREEEGQTVGVGGTQLVETRGAQREKFGRKPKATKSRGGGGVPCGRDETGREPKTKGDTSTEKEIREGDGKEPRP